MFYTPLLHSVYSCVSFTFLISGEKNAGRLNINLIDNQANKRLVWRRGGNHGKMWLEARVPIKQAKPFRVSIDIVRKFTFVNCLLKSTQTIFSIYPFIPFLVWDAWSVVWLRLFPSISFIQLAKAWFHLYRTVCHLVVYSFLMAFTRLFSIDRIWGD